MRYPNYTDPRAYQYFSWGFVGSGHGDVMDHECAKDRQNGQECAMCERGGIARSSHSTNFRNTCGIASTATVSTDRGAHYCAYCGNRAHTLQDGNDRNLRVCGHTCSCAGACDEREWVTKWNDMANRHSDEEVALKKEAPKQNKEVLKKLWTAEYQRTLKDLDSGYCHRQLEKVGIVLCNDPTAD